MADNQRDQQQGTQRQGAGGQQQGNLGQGAQRPDQTTDNPANWERTAAREQSDRDRDEAGGGERGSNQPGQQQGGNREQR